MYFVDRTKIEERLYYFEELLQLLVETEDWDTPIKKVALERMTVMLLEVTFDVGNSMIDGFIMRDPGSYDDIMDILMDEKVITTTMGEQLKELIPYRKMLVQDYTNIKHEELYSSFIERKETLKSFPIHIKKYLTNELGPVSAFSNNE